MYEKIVQLKMQAPDLKQRVTDAVDTTALLCIIQSISSPKADPLKCWLADVGAQRGDAHEAGEVAGNTRRDIEQRTGTKVVSSENYLYLAGGKKKKALKQPESPPNE